MAEVKDKERNIKSSKGKEQVTYQATPIRLLANFSAETLQARRVAQYI